MERMIRIASIFLAGFLFIATAGLVLGADDFKLEPGFVSLFNGNDLTGWGYRTNNLVAGPYKNLKLYKPQEWNEIVIEVANGVAHCTCNGELLENALPVPATGPIGLEGDRGQMEYRRIRIKEPVK